MCGADEGVLQTPYRLNDDNGYWRRQRDGQTDCIVRRDLLHRFVMSLLNVTGM